MDGLDEIVAALAGPSRVILISRGEVDLRPSAANNRLFLMKIGEGSLAAGGRGGGFGERKVTAVLCFEKKAGVWSKLFEADERSVERYEVPYYVSRLPITMADGSETMGYGVVDPELVTDMSGKSGIHSPA